MAKKKFELVVPMTFSADDVESILEASNRFNHTESPITIAEIANSPKLRKYLIQELQRGKDEVVEGSYEATANDWLLDICEHRKKQYRSK